MCALDVKYTLPMTRLLQPARRNLCTMGSHSTASHVVANHFCKWRKVSSHTPASPAPLKGWRPKGTVHGLRASSGEREASAEECRGRRQGFYDAEGPCGLRHDVLWPYSAFLIYPSIHPYTQIYIQRPRSSHMVAPFVAFVRATKFPGAFGT